MFIINTITCDTERGHQLSACISKLSTKKFQQNFCAYSVSPGYCFQAIIRFLSAEFQSLHLKF